ncbi:MAG: tRNA lysidine(34) synthetase TilS [Eubacterium sp.]|nr:tRNA lysidine(34) synthetase TilS [Eubacterium sp.]
MNNKINETIDKYNMLSRGDRVLVAVSGGADSMLLLNHMLSVREKYGVTVSAAHVDHGIRGEESADDARFVKDFCEKNKIEYHQLSIDAVNESKSFKMGVEEYSRKRRYEFFDSIPCDKIATAHNLSDNVETVLFRLSRGTGLKGACGIPAVRGKIIRPLIEIKSEEIRVYCESNGIAYRIDSTNADNDYTRNYIRNEIIPSLKKINPDFENTVSCFINDANEDMKFIDSVVDLALKKAFFDNCLKIDVLTKYDTAIAKRIILRYFSSLDISLDRLHLDEITQLIHKRGKIQISGNLFAVSNNEFLRLADFSERENDLSFKSKVLKISEFNPKGIDFYCDCDKIIGTVKIRSRIAGDEIMPAGRGCTKSLKKLFNELKIPQEMRSSVGVAVDDLGVIGVIGYCASERVKIDSKTQNIYCLLRLPSED